MALASTEMCKWFVVSTFSSKSATNGVFSKMYPQAGPSFGIFSKVPLLDFYSCHINKAEHSILIYVLCQEWYNWILPVTWRGRISQVLWAIVQFFYTSINFKLSGLMAWIRTAIVIIRFSLPLLLSLYVQLWWLLFSSTHFPVWGFPGVKIKCSPIMAIEDVCFGD